MTRTCGLIAAALIVAVTATARSALIITTGDHAVTEGSSVVVPILASTIDSAATLGIEGMTFTIQVADGAGTAPAISSIDFLTNTVWSGHVSPAMISQAAGGNLPQFQSFSLLTDTPGDLVNPNGALAFITIDASAAIPGQYTLRLTGTQDPANDSQLLDGLGAAVPATFDVGRLTVAPIPEPFGIAGLGALLFAGWRQHPGRRFKGTLARKFGSGDLDRVDEDQPTCLSVSTMTMAVVIAMPISSPRPHTARTRPRLRHPRAGS